MKKYFEILGLEEGASIQEIQDSYDKLSVELDPKNNDELDFFNEEFTVLNEAYKKLMDHHNKRKNDESSEKLSAPTNKVKDDKLIKTESRSDAITPLTDILDIGTDKPNKKQTGPHQKSKYQSKDENPDQNDNDLLKGSKSKKGLISISFILLLGITYLLFQTNILNKSLSNNSESKLINSVVSKIKIGDKLFGGIIFYLDHTGKHGLVAALEDATVRSSDPYGWGFNGYEWGCYDQYVRGSGGKHIGAGYQNTLDIINQGCTTENGGITAAQAAFEFELNGYDDWYLPSKHELEEMYLTIGKGAKIGNIGCFENGRYWSSTEVDGYGVDVVEFDENGYSKNLLEQLSFRVRPIRSF